LSADPILVASAGWLVFLLGATIPIYIAFGIIGLSGFRELTRYERHDSFYYRLNPATKILALFLVAVSTTSAGFYLGLLATLIILASYATLSKGRRKLWIGALFTIALAWATVWGSISDRITFLLSQSLNGAPSDLSFFYEDVTRSIAAEVAVSGVFLLALILVMTSTPSSVVRALRQIRMPNPITFSLVVGMKSVPALLDAINSTVKVQLMRGFGSRGSRSLGPLYTIAAVLLALIPALILVLRGARNTAISTGTRAFAAYKTRTYVTKPPFGAADVIVIVLAAGYLVVSVLALLPG
jgi:energy-coupling factor transport system permease protein